MEGFEFNKIYVIESLNDSEEKLTGKELFDDLLKWKEYQVNNFKAELIQLNTKVEFFNALDKIKDECTTSGQFPILHIEIHGSEDKTGLVLNSGELITWEELFNDLIDINSILGNNLFLTLAVCHGAYIMELIKIYSPAPFWGIIGSFDTITEYDLLIRYNEFYDEFLNSFDLSKAITRLHNANPKIESKYRFINSEATFHNIYKKYLSEKFSEIEIKKRFLDGLKEVSISTNDRNEKHKYRIQFKIKLLKSKKDFFEKHKNIFFMNENFPDNKKRFTIEFKNVSH